MVQASQESWERLEALARAAREGQGFSRRVAVPLCEASSREGWPERCLEARRRWAGEPVLCLDIPTLLADRLGLARAVLRALFSGRGATGWLALLRQARPVGLAPLSWCTQRLGLSPQGAQRLEAVLLGEDFAASRALTVRQEEEVELFNGEFAELPLPALGEQDARKILALLLERRRGPVHLWLTQLEELWLGHSPHRRGFLQGLRAWLERARGLPQVSLLATCWAPALSGIGAVDAALARQRWEAPGAAPEIDLWGEISQEEAREGLTRALGVASARPWTRRQVWCSPGEGRDVLWIWPQEERDPAAAVVELVGDMGQSRAGARIAAVVPAWAMGRQHEASRQALLRAFPYLGWVSLSSREAWCLARGQETPEALARIRQIWEKPEGAASRRGSE